MKTLQAYRPDHHSTYIDNLEECLICQEFVVHFLRKLPEQIAIDFYLPSEIPPKYHTAVVLRRNPTTTSIIWEFLHPQVDDYRSPDEAEDDPTMFRELSHWFAANFDIPIYVPYTLYVNIRDLGDIPDTNPED